MDCFRRVCVTVVVVCLGVLPLAAQDSLNVTRIGCIDSWDAPLELVVQNDLMFIASQTAGLLILRQDGFGQWQQIGRIGTASMSEGLAVAGNYAYLADVAEGLRIIDVSNPAAPVQVGFHPVDIFAMDVALTDHYAIITQGGDGVEIVNIANPHAPQRVAGISTGNSAQTTMIRDHWLYIPCADGGFHTYDISSLYFPTLTSAIVSEASYVDVAIRNSYAYVLALSADSNGVHVLNLDDPGHPEVVGFCPLEGWLQNITIAGNYAYVTAGWSGFYVVDLTNSEAPQAVAHQTGTSPLPWYTSITVVDDMVAYLNRSDGVRVLDLTTPATPVTVDSFGLVGIPRSIDVEGHFAYVGDDYLGLRVIDIQDPSQPVELSNRRGGWDIEHLDVIGTRAYFIEFAGLLVYDVSNPAQPRRLTEIEAASPLHDFAVVDNIAYSIGCNGPNMNPYLQIFDITNIYSPQQLSLLPLTGYPIGLALTEDYAYIAAGDSGLRIVMIANTEHPLEVGNCPLRGLYDVALAGQYAYVVGWEIGLQVLDLTDAVVPVPVASLYFPDYSTEVRISGDYAYIAGGDNGLRVVDISDPLHPAETGFYQTPYHAMDLAVRGTMAYVADHSQFGIFDCSLAAPSGVSPLEDRVPQSLRLAPPYPNPFNSATRLRFSLPQAAPVTLTACDVLGRRTAVLYDGRQAAGEHELRWDATGFPSGMYYLRLQAGSDIRIQKALLVK